MGFGKVRDADLYLFFCSDCGCNYAKEERRCPSHGLIDGGKPEKPKTEPQLDLCFEGDESFI